MSKKQDIERKRGHVWWAFHHARLRHDGNRKQWDSWIALYRRWLGALSVGDIVSVCSISETSLMDSPPEIFRVERMTEASVWVGNDHRRFNRRTGWAVGATTDQILPLLVHAGQEVLLEHDAGSDLVEIPIPLIYVSRPGVR
jgi:hypothetical protein